MRVLCEFADTWQIRTPHTWWLVFFNVSVWTVRSRIYLLPSGGQTLPQVLQEWCCWCVSPPTAAAPSPSSSKQDKHTSHCCCVGRIPLPPTTPE